MNKKALVGALAVAAASSVAVSGQAHPAVADLQSLCMPAHGEFKQAIAAADAAGWTKPGGDLASEPVQHMRLLSSGDERRVLTAFRKTTTLPSGVKVAMDICSAAVTPPAGDAVAAMRDLLGAEPVLQPNGHWAWTFAERAGRREFFKAEREALTTLPQGPVTNVEVWSDAGKTNAVYMAFNTQEPAPAEDEATARYQAALARMTPDSKPAEWQALRFAFAETPGFDAVTASLAPLHADMVRARKAGDNKAALALAEQAIEQNYADGLAHLIAFAAGADLKKTEAAKRHLSIAFGVFLSIATADGLTPATAHTVVSEQEEDFLVEMESRTVASRQRITIGDHAYDKVDTVGKDGPKTYYFEVDRILTREKKLAEGRT